MSFTEIIQELPKLSPEERHLLRQELDEKYIEDFEESPEMLAAIDEGLRSAREEPLIPIEDVMKEIPTWTLKSS